MKKTTAYILIFFASGFFSCKKNYTCECKNANGSYAAGDTEGTKRQARKYCQGLSGGSTTCDIQ